LFFHWSSSNSGMTGLAGDRRENPRIVITRDNSRRLKKSGRRAL
jgi:hypothetical protein